MDMAAWLWERVERRDAPAVLAHALSLTPTRDALLRQAAITEQWHTLAAASAEAADVARHVGWSRSGPDAVTAICHWISAEQTLRGIPRSDRAAPLAHAALAAWTAPSELAGRLASSAPLSSSQSMDFEQALSSDAAWIQEVDELEQRVREGPDAVRELLEDAQARTALLRHTARTGAWEDLADIAAEAEEQAQSDGTLIDGPRQVGQLSAWMAGTGDDPGQPLTRAELAEALAMSPWPNDNGPDLGDGDRRAPQGLASSDVPTPAPSPDPTPRR
jgi:hypothetical protein